jgi:hypothetical protein
MDLGGGGVLAAELRQLGGQLLEAIVEALILAFEEDRGLTKYVSIVDLFDTHYAITTSSSGARGKILLHRGDDKRRGRQRRSADNRAAFEEQLKLAHRQLERRRGRVPPEGREAAPFEAPWRRCTAPYHPRAAPWLVDDCGC